MFGEFMCQMYQYVQTLSYIASIFILILICVERYCAIIHPIKCKQILTPFRLRVCTRIKEQLLSVNLISVLKCLENAVSNSKTSGAQSLCARRFIQPVCSVFSAHLSYPTFLHISGGHLRTRAAYML